MAMHAVKTDNGGITYMHMQFFVRGSEQMVEGVDEVVCRYEV